MSRSIALWAICALLAAIVILGVWRSLDVSLHQELMPDGTICVSSSSGGMWCYFDWQREGPGQRRVN